MANAPRMLGDQSTSDSSGMQTQASQAMRTAEETPDSIYLGTVIASIAASALLYMMNKKDLSIFVGLWPPTLLNLALMLKQRRPSREMQQ